MAGNKSKKKSTIPSFAMPVAHDPRTGTVTPGPRTFRQPLATAPASTVGGLELSLSADGAGGKLFACLEGALTWSPAVQGGNPSRLTIAVDGITVMNRLRALQTIEAPVKQIIYENVDETTLQANLEKVLRDAYAFTVANPNDQSVWHPTMREARATGKKIDVTKSQFKVRLDGFGQGPAGDAQRSAEIQGVVTAFRTTPNPSRQIAVTAGDYIADAAGPDRRIVLYMIDSGDQNLNPLFYIHLYAHAPATKVNFLGPLAGHPLAVAYPVLNGSTPPPPREPIEVATGVFEDQFVLGPLQVEHDHRGSTSKWRYRATGEFEIDGALLTPSATETARARAVWQSLGAVIGPQAKELRVPCELATSIFVHESNGSETSFRLEPMNDGAREATQGLSELVKAYDKVTGVPASSFTIVKRNPVTNKFGEPPVTRMRVILSEAANIDEDRYVGGRKRLVIDETFRPGIAGNTGGSGTDFTFDVKEERFSGKVAQGPSLEATPMTTTVARGGRIRGLRTKVSTNKGVDYPATITLLVNDVATALVLSLPPKAMHAEASLPADATIKVGKNDRVALKVTTGARTEGGTTQLQAEMEWFLGLLDPADGTVSVYVLNGANQNSSGMHPLPAPWIDNQQIRDGSTLTYGQLAQLLDVEGGSLMSPGVAQTLIVVALETINKIQQYDPGILTRLGLTPVTKPSDTIRGSTTTTDPGWLFQRANAIFVGLVKMRLGYRDDNSRWDMPHVAANYNGGHIKSKPGTRTGMVLNKQRYPDACGRTYNALTTYFDGGATPAPTVRMKP